MKILVLHQYYLAKGDPGGSRFNELAALWAADGHAVTVVAGNLNYATGRRSAGSNGRWLTRERDGSVSVARCHVPATYNASALGRAWALVGFALSASWAVLREQRPDVVISTSPPLTIAIPGALAARLRFGRVPWMFEVRDLWPESAVTTGVMSSGAPLTRLLYRLEAWAYRGADRINVLTPAFREDILGRGLASGEKICFVPNGVDVEMFAPRCRNNSFRREMRWADDFVALYAGAHGRANALSQLLDAAEHLRSHPGVRIVSAGDGPERQPLIDTAAARGLSNIEFIGSQPKERMPELINAADAGLAVLQANPTFRTVYPNKVFDYMACARPTVLAIDGVARALVCDAAGAGVFAEPEDGAAIAARIRELAADPTLRAGMGARGRAWVVANASRAALAREYVTELQRCISAKSQVRGQAS